MSKSELKHAHETALQPCNNKKPRRGMKYNSMYRFFESAGAASQIGFNFRRKKRGK